MYLRPIIRGDVYDDPLYSGEECTRLFEIYEGHYRDTGFAPPWIGYIMVRKNTAVGTCGFKSAPVNGYVEIAYWTFEDFVNEGIATEGCRQLVLLAQNSGVNPVITARTLPASHQSARILEKNGFVLMETVSEPEYGEVCQWQLVLFG